MLTLMKFITHFNKWFPLLQFVISMSSYAQNTKDFSFDNKVAIVYPELLPEKRYDLISFYDSFIETLLREECVTELLIVHRPGLKEKLNKKFASNKLKFLQTKDVQDIWIKDWAPILTSGNAVKAFYSPNYFDQKEKKYAHLDDMVGFELIKFLNKDEIKLSCNNKRLILDGGNLIQNGQGLAITTNRIIAENESCSINQIQEIFKKRMGIDRLIFVPVEPGDVTGHVDGMIRFIDAQTIIVGAYESDYKEGKEFMDELSRQFESDFNVVRIVNATPKKQRPEEFPSAYGNYVNFLKIGDTIFLPQYDLSTDLAAKKEYEKYFKVVPIKIDVDKLAELGGVLNCITWTYK